jgi:hypothetical protein
MGTKIAVPNGIEEIRGAFGDPDTYLKPDGTLKTTWERDNIVRVPLPYPIPYAFAPLKITRIACHRLLGEKFVEVFKALGTAGIKPEYLLYGGCFIVRAMRTSALWSTHTWGIAIDLRPDTNKLGSKGDMDPKVIRVFNAHGFTWGGGWQNPDPMHFQYARGY